MEEVNKTRTKILELTKMTKKKSELRKLIFLEKSGEMLMD